MKKTLLIVIPFLVVLAAGNLFIGQARAGVERGREQWEYKVLDSSGRQNTENSLNQLGGQGWELVTAYDAGSFIGTRYTLKRRLQ